jgi:hypothetical protein
MSWFFNMYDSNMHGERVDTLYFKLKICTQRFYYSSSKFSKFIQDKSPLLQ